MDNEHEGSKRRTDDIYSKSLRARNRTYFFDVKSTKSE
ncbi:PUR family DNA/RNA-binding protein, partial [Vicingaceae bacterium]|nr:PUR family DNA/RNA-binding protein [Vicingaceae bacterium]